MINQRVFHSVKVVCFWCVIFSTIVCFCCVPERAFGQVIAITERVITFDKLTKTIIPFSASEEPHISVTPLPRSPYSIKALGKGDYQLVFDAQVPANAYTILISCGTQSKTCIWKVLPSMLEERNMKVLSALYLNFGKRVGFRSRLPIEAELPQQQFKIGYKFGNQPANFDNAYSDTWIGPCIPASATTVTVSVVWTYPPTGERVPLLSGTVYPQQTPPEIVANSPSVELLSDSLRKVFLNKGTIAANDTALLVRIKGFQVDYNVPIDADNSNPNASISIKASRDNIEVIQPLTIDFDDYGTNFGIYKGAEPESKIKWKKISPETFQVIESTFNREDASLSMIARLLMPKMPDNITRTVRGSLRLRARAAILNYKAGVKSTSFEEWLSVGFDIPYMNPSGTSDSPAEIAVKAREKEMCLTCSGASAEYPLWRVTSMALREEVQAVLLRMGRNIRKTPLGKDVPLIIGGRARGDGLYQIFTVRFGNEVMTQREIYQFIPNSLYNILHQPITETGAKAYLYDVLPPHEQEQQRRKIQTIALKAEQYDSNMDLRRLDNYRHSGLCLFEVDSNIVRRLSEIFTPSLPRTQGLEEAEKECSNAATIRELCRQQKLISPTLIDEGGSPQDCEIVKNYYLQLNSLVQIQRAYCLVDVRFPEPRILGIIPISARTYSGEFSTEALLNNLQAPLAGGLMTGAEMRRFKLEEYEQDDSTHAMIPVKGSFSAKPFTNIYEYCQDKIRTKKFFDRTQTVMLFPSLAR